MKTWFPLSLILLSAFSLFAQTTTDEREDEREARLILLRAADQLEFLGKKADAFRQELNALQENILDLKKENTELRQEIQNIRLAWQENREQQAIEKKGLLKEIKELVLASPPSPHLPEKPSPPGQTGFFHEVKKGQTLSLIAEAFRQQGITVTVEEICEANQINNDHLIHIGQKLFIPKKRK